MNGQNSHRPRSPEAYSPKIHYRDRDRSGSDASRRRSRRRLLLLALLSTIAFSLYLYHVYAADPSSSRGTLPPQSNPPVGPHQKDGTAPSKRWFWFRSTARRRASAPSSSFGTRLQSSKYPYILPNELLPVHHEERHVIYHNGPLAPTRPPPNQFLLDPRADLSQPVVGIITATNNPREVMRETAASLFAQSLQNFVWIIVSDHTTQSASAAILRDLARDPRVHVVTNTGAQGLSEGRNVGIEWLLAHYDPPPPYLISLDDDDLFELTALEKACWMLESNPTWDLAGFRYIKFGAANETVVTGLHSNAANYKAGNFVPNAAIYTSRALLASGCRYDEKEFDEGGEDWDFWMCLAEHGHWGGSLLEPLYWYRVNPPSFRSQRWGKTFISGFETLKAHVQRRHPSLKTDFPSKVPLKSAPLEPVRWDAPFSQALAHTDRQMMFIVPWLYFGGADIGLLHMVELYAQAGYRVTVVCTLSKVPDGLQLRPWVLQYTHDVHVLPSTVRARDMPRYLVHLIRSRGVQEVIFSNSQLIYEMLPALVEQVPHVKWIDYLHNEAYDGWKMGGYPRYSVLVQRYLARTLTCSQYMKDWLLERGHLDADRIGVVKLGIEASHFVPATPSRRHAMKETLLGVDPETVVITFVGRLDPQKRPLLVPRIANELIERIPDLEVVFVMLGDGEERHDLEEIIKSYDLDDIVRVEGLERDPAQYYAASDIFLLPSVNEGISIAVAEAMAMGLPIVTARTGALPEQLGEVVAGKRSTPAHDLGGILVDHELDTAKDTILYADALEQILLDPALRNRLGRNARKLANDGLDWRITLSALFHETELAENLPGHGDTALLGYPHPAAEMAIQSLLIDAWKETDQVGYYPRS
ncbi:hypothetical protein C6P46_000618 [Rhodotorula mucilaginosa]|uniref:Glycosyltransferase family 4 protein n=1 Tax=Rhodotorula mucilaginosa TaxID=5537 RepID=A0A9P6W7X2_RHOMI|nr:hypothetical protein C6P46_000618 [Rhodotorula mucilaginosa]